MSRFCSPSLSVSLFTAVAGVAVLGGCGASQSEGPASGPLPAPSQPGPSGAKPKDADASKPGGSPSKTPRLWRSDVDGSLGALCSKGQAFARGLCWDEVHFRPGGVFLSRPGETWAFFENGAQVSSFIQKGHVYLGYQTIYDGPVHGAIMFRNVGVAAVNSWLKEFPSAESPDAGKVSGSYAFLPEEIGLWTPDEARSLEVAKVTDAKFPVSSDITFADPDGTTQTFSWPLEGSVEVCGQVFKLPTFTQGDIESACKTGPLGETQEAQVSVPNGHMHFRLFLAAGNTPAERKPYSVAYALGFPDPDLTPTPTPEPAR